MRSLGLIGCVCLIGCGRGKLPTPEQVSRLNFSMSLAEVEAILGPGETIEPQDVLTPPPEALKGFPEDLRPKVVPPPPVWVVAQHRNATWKRWGDDSAYLILSFSDGKMLASKMNNVGGTIGRDPDAPELPRSGLSDEMLAESRKSSRYLFELSDLSFSIRDYADNHATMTPADLETLAKGFTPISPEVKDAVRSGEIVVVWNAKKGTPILAYPKMALTADARYLDDKADVQDSTPERIKKLLDERK